ncbi:MAG: hypothetical protein ACM3XM_13680 [Mycobacterium leprae]
MDKRTAVELAAAQMAEVAATRTLQPYNFREVDVDERPVRDPEWVIRGDDTMADLNAQAALLLLQATKQAHVDEVHPNFLALHQVAENPNEIVATPAAKEAQNTLRVKWSKDGSRAMVNIRLLLKVRPFSIPPRVSVHIPVTLEHVEGAGPSQILHLDRTYTVPMVDRPARVAPPAPESTPPTTE